MWFVIGSGPAGVACAAAVLERGLPVTMLDAGIPLPQDIARTLARLQSHWDDTAADTLKQRLDTGNLVKLSYGSDYLYREVTDHFALSMDKDILCEPSFAQGGLSNAWGAFIGKYDEGDMTGWPVTRAQMEPYYKAAYSLLPRAVSQESEDAANCANVYAPSRQARELLSGWRNHRDTLAAQGFRFAPAELAVRFGPVEAPLCNYSGRCMHGCPLDLIYTARHTLEHLRKNPKFRYIGDCVVTGIEETLASIIIRSHDRLTREPKTFKGERVFTACGPILSTQLALRGAGFTDKVTFRDSSHFMVPGLMKRRAPNVERERLHTLAQLSLKLSRPDIVSHPLHLQLYTYMDHYTAKLKELLRFTYAPLKPLLPPILDRMIVLHGFLHSDDSHALTLHLDDSGAARLKSRWNDQVEPAVKKIVAHLGRNARYFGFTPLAFMKSISKIGKSVHYGASLPMRERPEGAESDTLGRSFGRARWHSVDASVLPAIPAGSITPSIMANAWRIATECPA